MQNRTIGAALDADGAAIGYVCLRRLSDVYGTRIRCSIYPGAHGTETLSDLIKHSCNDGLMQIGALLGPEEFLKYQKIFNFGATTGIDLPGEATGYTSPKKVFIREVPNLPVLPSDRDTCTMIQRLRQSVLQDHGGYYYQPHVVSKNIERGRMMDQRCAACSNKTDCIQ